MQCQVTMSKVEIRFLKNKKYACVYVYMHVCPYVYAYA